MHVMDALMRHASTISDTCVYSAMHSRITYLDTFVNIPAHKYNITF